MAQKATHRQTDPSSPTPVVLFGVDENGKPKAARFPEKQADLATKAAGHLKLQVLPIVGSVVVDLAGRVPAVKWNGWAGGTVRGAWALGSLSSRNSHGK